MSCSKEKALLYICLALVPKPINLQDWRRMRALVLSNSQGQRLFYVWPLSGRCELNNQRFFPIFSHAKNRVFLFRSTIPLFESLNKVSLFAFALVTVNDSSRVTSSPVRWMRCRSLSASIVFPTASELTTRLALPPPLSGGATTKTLTSAHYAK